MKILWKTACEHSKIFQFHPHIHTQFPISRGWNLRTPSCMPIYTGFLKKHSRIKSYSQKLPPTSTPYPPHPKNITSNTGFQFSSKASSSLRRPYPHRHLHTPFSSSLFISSHPSFQYLSLSVFTLLELDAELLYIVECFSHNLCEWFPPDGRVSVQTWSGESVFFLFLLQCVCVFRGKRACSDSTSFFRELRVFGAWILQFARKRASNSPRI